MIDAERPKRAAFLYFADFDEDGWSDVVTGAFWYRNPGQAVGGWERNAIGDPFDDTVIPYDFDGDGDLDLLGTAGPDNTLPFVWARNEGKGRFTIFDNIDSNLIIRNERPIQGVVVAHFHPGGPLQVALAWDDNIGGTQMLTVPDDPSVTEWTRRQVSKFSEGEALSSADIDSDGDIDLFTGSTWLRNNWPDDSWTPIPIYTFTSGAPDRNKLVDMDGDGDLDAVVGYGHDPEAKVAWYEQPGDPYAPWPEHIIANLTTPRSSYPQSLDVADMDGDGDLDVVAGHHRYHGNLTNMSAFVIENLDGKGTLWQPHLVYTGDEHHDGTQVIDVDGDGDLDIVSIGWMHGRVILYENKSEEECQPEVPTATEVFTPTSTMTVTATETPTATSSIPPTETATPTQLLSPTATLTATATMTPSTTTVPTMTPEATITPPGAEFFEPLFLPLVQN